MGWQQHYAMLAIVKEQDKEKVEKFRSEVMKPNEWERLLSWPMVVNGDFVYTFACTDAKSGEFSRTVLPASKALIDFLNTIDAEVIGLNFGADMGTFAVTYYRAYGTEWIDPNGNPFSIWLDNGKIMDSPGDYMHHSEPYYPYERAVGG